MKKYWIFMAIGLMVLSLQAQNKLVIDISNIELIEGELMLRLTSNPELFDDGDLANEQLAREEVNAHQMKIIFNDIPDGTYAFAIFQDLNENEELDKRKFGIPAEPFVFSNNALGTFGPPKFSEASFDISGGSAHVQQVKMIYNKPKRKDRSNEK